MQTFAWQYKRPNSTYRKTAIPSYRPGRDAQRAAVGQILRSTGIQAKLTVGAPDDAYEREADRVADAVMRMPQPEIQRAPG